MASALLNAPTLGNCYPPERAAARIKLSDDELRRMASLLDSARIYAGPDARKMAKRILKRSIRLEGEPGSGPEHLRRRIAKVEKAARALGHLTFYGPPLEELAVEADAVLEKIEEAIAGRRAEARTPF